MDLGWERSFRNNAFELMAKHDKPLRPFNLEQVSEASVARSRSTIIVPAGNASDDGWATFRNILVEIHEASQLLVPPPNGSGPPQVSFTAVLLIDLWFSSPISARQIESPHRD
jgi:hypothetical protein